MWGGGGQRAKRTSYTRGAMEPEKTTNPWRKRVERVGAAGAKET